MEQTYWIIEHTPTEGHVRPPRMCVYMCIYVYTHVCVYLLGAFELSDALFNMPVMLLSNRYFYQTHEERRFGFSDVPSDYSCPEILQPFFRHTNLFLPPRLRVGPALCPARGRGVNSSKSDAPANGEFQRGA